jgi:hypothetical protein
MLNETWHAKIDDRLISHLYFQRLNAVIFHELLTKGLFLLRVMQVHACEHEINGRYHCI